MTPSVEQCYRYIMEYLLTGNDYISDRTKYTFELPVLYLVLSIIISDLNWIEFNTFINDEVNITVNCRRT